ncbi:MAG TPA: response regulator [Patescibacteria group bacterium]|nr:response regulator [Patescibacteria group bacterium]
MKLRILLVDDEPKVLRGLRTIIDRANENWEIVGECRNGIEALALISQINPDVVITDIKMPCMDGLELVERVKETAPELKFIILSGYPDFKYAQKAIRLETADYILKPPDYKDILKSIKKVELQKLEKSARKEEEEELRKIREATVQPMRDKFFYEMIYRTDFYSANQDKIGVEDYNIFSSKFALFLVKPDDSSFFLFDATDEKLKRLSAFRESLQNIVYGRSGCIADFYDGTYCCFFNVESNDKEYLKSFAKVIREELSLKFAESITIGVSKAYDSPDKINRAYKECLNILRNKVFYEKNCIIYLEDIKADSSSEGYPLEHERKYIEALKFAEHERAVEILKKIIDRVVSISNQDPMVFKSLILEFTVAVARSLSDAGMPGLSDSFPGKGIYNKLNSLDNIGDVRDFLIEYTGSIADYFDKRNIPGCRKIINEIKLHIHNNYFTNISLRQIANEFFMNESYLSDLFKKETGVSFTSYLTKERMEKAKELLKQGDLKIYDISEMVGYSNPRYFNSVFKKYAGLTPFEYRERIV